MPPLWRTHTRAEPQTALDAAQQWELQPASIGLIAHSGNSVYRAKRKCETVILRLTDSNYRTAQETAAELAFIDHLSCCGVQVSCAIPSVDGMLVEEVSCTGNTFLACLFEYAPGTVLTPSSAGWNDELLIDWGRSLATLHKVSGSAPALHRWHWCEEHLIEHALDILPANDERVRHEFQTVFDWFSELVRNPGNYGMTHSDYGPGNYHYTQPTGITAFDFGNCCYHWYLWDLAVGFRWLSTFPEAERLQASVLRGYQSVLSIEACLLARMSWFIRLRLLYIYLDRRAKFLYQRDDESRVEAEFWRNQIHLTPSSE